MFSSSCVPDVYHEPPQLAKPLMDKWGACKPACKPGSVPAALFTTLAGRRSPAAGDGHPSTTPVARRLQRPDPGHGASSPWAANRPSLFGLAPDGVYLAGRSPGRRWALTPPFHRCRDRSRGCVISVALSFGSPRLGVTQRPALWSPDFPRTHERPRPSGRLARRFYRRHLSTSVKVHLFALTRSHRTATFRPPVGQSGEKWGIEARNVQRRSRRRDGSV